jgi:hypothetical protein
MTILLVVIASSFFVLLATITALAYATTTNMTVTEQPEQNRTVTSKGCGEGWGYYVDNPNPICEPLDKLGEGPQNNTTFCAALGCPYNPPDLSKDNPPP